VARPAGARHNDADDGDIMASTVIGAGITVEGEITTDEDVVVAGTVRGKLTAKEGVTIEHGATVEADVAGASLVVGGSLTGNVKAARVTIADGAQFKGNVDMDV